MTTQSFLNFPGSLSHQLDQIDARETPNQYNFIPPSTMDGYDSSSLDSSSISSGISSRSSFFSRNSSRQSLDSKNSAYMHLESQLEESKQHIHLLEQRNQQLARDRDLLSAQVAALQSSFITLTNSLGRNGHIVNTVTTSSANEADKDLSPDEYEDVKFWTRSKWTLHVQAEKAVAKLGSSAASTQRGSTRLAKGENVACQFIEDAAGVPVDGHRAKAARSVFSAYLHQLNQAGVKLPTSWSQVPLDLKEGFYHAIRTNYIEFRYCADNWKAEHLATQNYSQWYKYHIGGTESSSSHVKKPKNEVAAPEDSDLEYMDIDNPPSVTSNQSPVVITSPTHDTLDDFIDPALKALGAPSNPDTDTPATVSALAECSEPSSSCTSKEKTSLVVPEVKNPLLVAGVSGTFRLGGPTYTSATLASSSSSSSSIPATTTMIPPTTTAIPATTTMIPATTTTIPAMTTTIPATTTMITATTVNTIPALTTTKPKPKPKPRPVKAPTAPKEPNAPSKAKAMRIQKTINARCVESRQKSAGHSEVIQRILGATSRCRESTQAQTLLATNTLAPVATTGSGPRGNTVTEEEFAGSDGDE
ncbi:hypothetical protein DEU56DRAFT_953014 [Suillus clintonianus]|uniref:uncharacterized protein n=1 Tax=Suillus clintonianus TaxID=1904413 RepID=UPI001B8813D3|nr:uncharacterized protein DEU56DRAFT_953014 [Suillus clintonianus]KAG2132047.1 hypothetical protein DEU56DRAFT_953014 [Suillus clintonianus]